MGSLNEDLFCSVSPNGAQVALCTSDGVIRIYDSLTSSLKGEYSSSAHLKGVCTCVSWSTPDISTASLTNSAQKKIKTSSANNKYDLNDLIAIGTNEGSVLVYHLTKASLHTIMQDDSNTDKINDLCWSSNCSIYSCSNEGSVTEWSLVDSKPKSKWKASKIAITSIYVDNKSDYIMCSSKSISIWDLDSKTKLKTLTGHSNDIFKLVNVNCKLNNDYFLSAAVNDRIINTWVLDKSNLEQSSTASLMSFSLNDSPIYIDAVNINVNKSQTDPIALVIVVTSRGSVCLYLNELAAVSQSKSKKSIKPIRQLELNSKDAAQTIKIHSSFVTNQKNERLNSIDLQGCEASPDANQLLKHLGSFYLHIVYGASVNPKIEKIQFNELNENKVTLVREDPSKMSVSLQTQVTKIETPAVAKELKVVVPSLVGPQVVNSNNSIDSGHKASKRKPNETDQITLEERLNIMGINTTSNNDSTDVFLKNGQLPKTDNLLVLLVQGLQSNDTKMLNYVLQHKNDKVIFKTVSSLPSQYIIMLIKELNKRLQGHAQSCLAIIKWLKPVLMIHTSYLMSYPELIESLGRVYEMMNARTKLFPQLSKLQGKLQLAMSQISSQNEKLESNGEKDSQELLYYQESTSEDEQIEDDLIPSHSEYDEYLFSEEEDEESNQDENEMDDNNGSDTQESKELDAANSKQKKTVASFKKITKNSKQEEDEDEDGDDDDDEDDDEDDDDDDEEDENILELVKKRKNKLSN